MTDTMTILVTQDDPIYTYGVRDHCHTTHEPMRNMFYLAGAETPRCLRACKEWDLWVFSCGATRNDPWEERLRDAIEGLHFYNENPEYLGFWYDEKVDYKTLVPA